MALNNTTFTQLSTWTRDLTSEPGSVYFLDGNHTNWRLNIWASAKVIFWDNSHIFVNWNSSHTHMLGVIEWTGLTYILKPNGGRADFWHNEAGYDTTDITFILLGNGSLFHHLEDDRALSDFKGFTRIIFNRSWGSAYVQFASKEYPNVELQFKSGNSGDTNIYMARLTPGFTSLTWFKTSGITSEIQIWYGTNNTSSGRIYDPIYAGATNNLLPLRIGANNGPNKHMHEYFSIDVTNIRHDDAKIRVVDSTWEVQHNDISLTISNTTPMANDGTTALSYYNGRAVILVKVREITTNQSNSRRSISYIIRRPWYNEIKVDNLSMNNPVTIEEMWVDENWSNTWTITDITTSSQLYDEINKYLANNFDSNIEYDRESTKITINKSIVLDGTASSLFSYDWTTITIKTTTYTEDITTTGSTTVTTANWAVMSGFISDSIWDSNIIAIVPSGYENDIKVYANKADAEAETNHIASWSSFRYQSATYGGQTLWFRMTENDWSFIVENYIVPNVAWSNTVNLVVTSQNQALWAVKAVTDKLDLMLEVVNWEQVFKNTALRDSDSINTNIWNIPSETRAELATELWRIDENISTEKDANIKKVNWVTVWSISDFHASTDVSAIVNEIDVRHGKGRYDTSPVIQTKWVSEKSIRALLDSYLSDVKWSNESLNKENIDSFKEYIINEMNKKNDNDAMLQTILERIDFFMEANDIRLSDLEQKIQTTKKKKKRKSKLESLLQPSLVDDLLEESLLDKLI